MNNRDITAALAALEEASFLLEEEYEMNGGEVTEETEAQEEYIESLKALLEDEGIDSLGRWLKSKEDLIKTLKAERDSVNRQIKKTENGIEYIIKNRELDKRTIKIILPKWEIIREKRYAEI